MLFLLMAVSNIVSECVKIMHTKASLCQNDLCSSKCRQNAPFIVVAFIFISAVPNCFKYRQNAQFSVPVLKIFSEALNCFKRCSKLVFEKTLEYSILPSMFSELSGGTDSLPHAPLTQNHRAAPESNMLCEAECRKERIIT